MIFSFINNITDRFPQRGARAIDWTILNVIGNDLVLDFALRVHAHRVKAIKRFARVVVIADVNIGDAVFNMAAVSAIREQLPDAKIDFVINRRAKGLIFGDIALTIHPVLSGCKPGEEEITRINEIVRGSPCDLVFNFNPFLSSGRISFPRKKIVGHIGLAAMIFKAQKDPQSVGHIIFQMREYIEFIFGTKKCSEVARSFHGVDIELSNQAIEEAYSFFIDNDIDPESDRLVYWNPDTATPATLIPFGLQVRMIRELTKLPCKILLGAGYKQKGIELNILAKLTACESSRVTLVPKEISIEAFAVIVDRCNTFISGDTGPIHVAAAHKRAAEGFYPFRNRTAIISIFGPTPARVYGYDSRQDGYLRANQAAECRTYVPESHQRTFMHIFKNNIPHGHIASFFEKIDVDHLLAEVKSFTQSCGGMEERAEYLEENVM
jgi:ADP-heptose:LPS heptosyltransferase